MALNLNKRIELISSVPFSDLSEIFFSRLLCLEVLYSFKLEIIWAQAISVNSETDS